MTHPQRDPALPKRVHNTDHSDHILVTPKTLDKNETPIEEKKQIRGGMGGG